MEYAAPFSLTLREKTMNEVLETLINQRTTRRNDFNGGRIDKNDIEALKATILKTANASNRQSYSIIIMDRGKAAGLGFPGDVVLLFCVDFLRLHKCAEKLGMDFDSVYPMQFATALTDVSMLAQSAILAAQSMGISTLITNEVYHSKLETLFKALDIPDKHVFPMLAVCMGYSEIKDKSAKGRLDPKQIFHENSYQEPDEDEIDDLISEYDDKDKNIALIRDWDEKGYAHYLQWFFEKWCPAVGNRKQGEGFLAALKAHGMI